MPEADLLVEIASDKRADDINILAGFQPLVDHEPAFGAVHATELVVNHAVD